MSEPFKFKIGDKVKCVFFGDRIFTLGISDHFGMFHLEELSDGANQPTFLDDGRYSAYHTQPSLILVERPKKKVAKSATYIGYVNIYPSGEASIHSTRELAGKYRLSSRISCIETIGNVPYEVEE